MAQPDFNGWPPHFPSVFPIKNGHNLGVPLHFWDSQHNSDDFRKFRWPCWEWRWRSGEEVAGDDDAWIGRFALEPYRHTKKWSSWVQVCQEQKTSIHGWNVVTKDYHGLPWITNKHWIWSISNDLSSVTKNKGRAEGTCPLLTGRQLLFVVNLWDSL